MMNTDTNILFQKAVDASGEIIFMTDINGIITYINPEFTRVYGYSKEEIINKTTPRILKSGKMDTDSYNHFWATLINNKIVKQKLINKSKNDREIIVENTANSISDEAGNIIGYIAIQRDITERLNEQEALATSEDRLRYITDNMHDLVSQLDLNGVYKYCSPSYQRVLGYSENKLLESSAFLNVHPDDLNQARSKFEKIINFNCTQEMDMRLKSSTGKFLWFHSIGSLLLDKNNNPTGVIVTSTEITERKNIEYELNNYRKELENTVNNRTTELKSIVNRLKSEINEREQIESDLIHSREEFKTLADNLPDIIIRYNNQLQMVYSNINKDFCEMLNESSGEAKSINTLKKEWNDLIITTIISKEVRKGYFEIMVNDNKEYFEAQTVPELSEAHKVESVLAVVRNLTERKKIETEIKLALAEKDVLLREIHHRVKNNLQSIIYLIDMQLEVSENKQLINSLKDLQYKVKTMSIVHEQLYKSKNLSQVDFEEYLKSLLYNLHTIFQTEQNVEIKYHTTEHLMNIETVLPCGMIINELITNSVKYAFPENFSRGDNWHPLIKIDLSKNGDYYHLVVEDNGIGLPENINWREADSLGLKLVNIWASYQLNGNLEVSNEEGTRFEIKFQKGF